MNVIEAKGINKTFSQAGNHIVVLKDLDLSVSGKSTTAIVGKSGSGKSTLISVLAGLESISDGDLNILGKDIVHCSEKIINSLRRESYGIVFQKFHLLSHLTALDNVMLPLELNGIDKAKEKAMKALEKVGLSSRKDHKPSRLSGGEQQRVAIARAIVHEPKILLADEPSGSLDEQTGKTVMDLLFEITENSKTAMILVTHDMQLAKRCQRVLKLENGKLLEV